MSTLHPNYLKLLRQVPLRPFRAEREYDAAVQLMNQLAVLGEGALDPGQQDYFETLCLLVDAYDKERHQLDTSDVTPHDILRELMTSSKLTVKDLAAIIGSQPLASMILSGTREISRRVAIRLAEHFKLEPGIFLSRGTVKQRAS